MKSSRVSRKKGPRRPGQEQRGAARRPSIAQGVSTNIPPKNYMQTHIAGVPSSQRQTLSWAYQGTVGITSAYAEASVIVLNSPYDPDYAAGGTSSAGFAKWMAFYSKCFVLGARATLKFAMSGTSVAGPPTEPVATGLTITTNVSSLGSTLDAIQNGLCDYKVMNLCPDSGVLSVGVDVAKFVDKPDILDDNQFFCTATGNPGQLIVLHHWVDGLSSLTTISQAYVIEVEMDCVFTDPIPFT